MKIAILRDKCVGSGNCVDLAGRVFGQSDDDGKVLLVDGDEWQEDAAIVEAAMLCPVGAILIDGELP